MNYIYLSTNQGLYISIDGVFWEKFDTPITYLNQQIFMMASVENY